MEQRAEYTTQEDERPAQPQRHTVLLKCEMATEAIFQLDPQEWPGWITWMLEALDDVLPELETIDLLSTVRNEIDQRLETGNW